MNSPMPTDRPLWKRLLLRRLKFLLVLALLVVVVGGGSYLFAPGWVMRVHTWYQAEQAGLTTHHVQVGDTNWAYYEGGEGPTLVLLHGFGMDRSAWLKVAPQLTRNFHLVIPDLPGWGDSTRHPGDNYDIDHQAERLQGFVHTLELKHFVLIGHSMGGAIAGTYASEHPDNVSALALISSYGLSFVKNRFAREALDGHDLLAFDDRAGLERVLKLVYAHPPKIASRFADVLVSREKASKPFLDRAFRELATPAQYRILDDRLGKLTMPVLGLWCHDDKVIDVSALNTLRNGLVHAPTISATVLNGCGHVPELEKPEETARILAGFAVAH